MLFRKFGIHSLFAQRGKRERRGERESEERERERKRERERELSYVRKTVEGKKGGGEGKHCFFFQFPSLTVLPDGFPRQSGRH